MTEHNTIFDRGRDIGYFPLVQSSHPFAVWRGLGSALIFGLIAQATKQHHNTLCTAEHPLQISHPVLKNDCLFPFGFFFLLFFHKNLP